MGFADEVVVHYLPEEDEEEETWEKPTAMERAKELDRLKEWVKAHSETMGDEESSEWVHKLVELEMGEMEKEDLTAESPCVEKTHKVWCMDAEDVVMRIEPTTEEKIEIMVAEPWIQKDESMATEPQSEDVIAPYEWCIPHPSGSITPTENEEGEEEEEVVTNKYKWAMSPDGDEIMTLASC